MTLALGTPKRAKARLGVIIMAFALVLASFLGAAAGLIWQNADVFSEDTEEEVLTQ